MKKSFELEECFKSLNHIPRSLTQKRKTYEHILLNRGQKKDFWERSGLKGRLLTIAMFFFVSAFLYQVVLAPENMHHGSVKTVDQIGDSEVIRTYIARSDSDHYFSLYPYITRKGVSIQEEQLWTQMIRQTLIGMEIVSDVPDSQASYDMLILFDDRKAAKFKLLIARDVVYLKHIQEGQIYKAGPSQSWQITKTVSDLEEHSPF